MKIQIVTAMPTALFLLLTGIAASAQTPATLRSPDTKARAYELAASYGNLPLSFEPNQGQADPRVQFVSRGAGYNIFLSAASATFALQPDAMAETAVIRMELVGANSDIRMQPQDKLPGITNYLMGSNRTQWPTNLPTYAKTRSRNVYPGIDLIYYGNQGQLEYDFVVAPEADASKIRLKFAGATPVIGAAGDLVLQNGIRFQKPALYQMVQGIREPVNGKFILAADHQEVSFQIGSYDHNLELVIDPVLVYSSYLGGSSQATVIRGMALNAAGQIYVTGVTNALDYPTTTGVVTGSCPPPMTGGTKCGPSSSSAAFVTKISADGQSLIYSTYLGGGGAGPGVGGSTISQGGSGSEFTSGIAVDANDNAWVLGGTNSNNFPVTPDAYSLYCEPASASFDFNTRQFVGELSACARFNGGGEYVYSGSYSLFLVKLNPTGTKILYGTFLGGTQGESPGQIALDAAGRIFISGSAYTGDVGTPAVTGQYIYPTTASAFQSTPLRSAFSAFVTELAPDGRSLVYSSFLFASVGQTFGGPLAIGAGKIFIGGYTQSPTLPTTRGALSSTCPGSATQCPNNGFVAEFDPAKSGAASLVFSTYLNGKHVSSAGIGFATSIVSVLAADTTGNVYAAGTNQYLDFPTTPGVLQQTCNSSRNDSCSTGFVTKLNPAGALVWSTFYGSPSASGQFGVAAMALDSSNNVYIANLADGAGDLPLKNGLQDYNSGVAYVTELSSDGSQVLFGSFFGAGANIYPTAMVVDAARNIFLAGYTAGALPLVNPLQSTNAGGFNEGFVAKISGAPQRGDAPAAFVSAASSLAGAVAAGSIVSAYGTNLATGIASAVSLPLPTTLAGTSVTIVDSKGVSTRAPLFFVSPGQVNFQIPTGAAAGNASISIASGDGTISAGTVVIAAVAPGLFVVNSAGLVAANVITNNTDGSQVTSNTFQVVNGATVALPVNLGPPAKQVILVLYGTGISGRSSLANVSVTIGGQSLPVVYAGPQGDAGLDQVNVQIPASLAGIGDTTISVTVDGVVSKAAHLTIL